MDLAAQFNRPVDFLIVLVLRCGSE